MSILHDLREEQGQDEVTCDNDHEAVKTFETNHIVILVVNWSRVCRYPGMNVVDIHP
jgi:hypothetical protein